MFRCQGQLWIKVDHFEQEINDVGCFADAVQLLIATFFVFNIQRPYHLRPTYDIFESLLKLTKHPRTTGARELLRIVKSKLPFPVSVYDTVNNISCVVLKHHILLAVSVCAVGD